MRKIKFIHNFKSDGQEFHREDDFDYVLNMIGTALYDGQEITVKFKDGSHTTFNPPSN